MKILKLFTAALLTLLPVNATRDVPQSASGVCSDGKASFNPGSDEEDLSLLVGVFDLTEVPFRKSIRRVFEIPEENCVDLEFDNIRAVTDLHQQDGVSLHLGGTNLRIVGDESGLSEVTLMGNIICGAQGSEIKFQGNFTLKLADNAQIVGCPGARLLVEGKVRIISANDSVGSIQLTFRQFPIQLVGAGSLDWSPLEQVPNQVTVRTVNSYFQLDDGCSLKGNSEVVVISDVLTDRMNFSTPLFLATLGDPSKIKFENFRYCSLNDVITGERQKSRGKAENAMVISLLLSAIVVAGTGIYRSGVSTFSLREFIQMGSHSNLTLRETKLVFAALASQAALPIVNRLITRFFFKEPGVQRRQD